MYARTTTIHGEPEAMTEGIGYIRYEVMPAVHDMEGCVGLSMFADRPAGRCIITTAWEDLDALRRSADAVVPMRRRAAEVLRGDAEVQEWEIALVHRMHGIHHGACARVIRTEGDPARLEHMLDVFRMSLLPLIEDLPGFCSVSVMLDRSTGRGATSVSYDSRVSMAEAERPGAALREEFARQMGMTVTDVAAFDIELANLRVPETV